MTTSGLCGAIQAQHHLRNDERRSQTRAAPSPSPHMHCRPWRDDLLRRRTMLQSGTMSTPTRTTPSPNPRAGAPPGARHLRGRPGVPPGRAADAVDHRGPDDGESHACRRARQPASWPARPPGRCPYQRFDLAHPGGSAIVSWAVTTATDRVVALHAWTCLTGSWDAVDHGRGQADRSWTSRPRRAGSTTPARCTCSRSPSTRPTARSRCRGRRRAPPAACAWRDRPARAGILTAQPPTLSSSGLGLVRPSR